MKYTLLTHPFSKIDDKKNYIAISDLLKPFYIEFKNVKFVSNSKDRRFYFKEIDEQCFKNKQFSIKIYKKILKICNYQVFNERQIKINLGWITDIFSRITYGRYSKIKYIFENFFIDEVELVSSEYNSKYGNTEDFLNDLKGFPKNNFIFDSYLNKEIIDFFFVSRVKYIFKEVSNIEKNKIYPSKNFLKLVFNRLNYYISFFNKIIFISPFLSKFEQLKLDLALFQIPFYLPHIKFKYENYNIKERDRIYSLLKLEDESYLNFFLKFFIKMLPSIYLEDLHNLKKNSTKIKIPRSDYVFSSNLFSIYDELKFNVSSKKIELITGQHGSNYGTASYRMNPSIEEINSDYFLTWGWTKRQNNLSGFNFINHKLTKNIDYNAIAVVLGAQSAITYYDDTFSFYDYINKCSKFLKKIDYKIYKKIILRPHKNEFNIIDEIKFWNSEHPKIKIHDHKKSLETLINNSFLTIFTYEASSFFHSLNIKKPCIYINFHNLDNVNLDVKKIYEVLIDAKILFLEPNEAVNHLNLISNKSELMKWWNSEKVVNSIEYFNSYLNRSEKNKIETLKKIFLNIKKNKT